MFYDILLYIGTIWALAIQQRVAMPTQSLVWTNELCGKPSNSEEPLRIAPMCFDLSYLTRVFIAYPDSVMLNFFVLRFCYIYAEFI